MRAYIGVVFLFLFLLSGSLSAGQDFILQSDRVFTPNERAYVKVYQRGTHSYEVCVWRIKKVLDFFLMQADIARPQVEGTTLREALDAAIEKTELDRPELFRKGLEVKENIFEYLGMQKLVVKTDKWRAAEVELQLPGVGVYLVELREGIFNAYCVVAVSEMVMLQKRTEGNLLLFVAKRSDGSPISGAKVLVYSGRKKVAEGMTSRDGTVSIQMEYRPSFRIFATKGNDITCNESVYYPVAVESIKCYLYTDRPVYRSGERLYFKGIVRVFKDGVYGLPPQTNVKYKIVDVRKVSVAEGELNLSRFGTFSGEYEIPDEARLGEYMLIASVGKRSFQSIFFVEKYRKPEFRVSVRTDRPHYVQGERIKFTICADYLFGGAVAKASVSYTIFRSRFRANLFAEREASLYLTPQEFEFFKEEVVGGGRGETDERGEFVVEFQTERLPYDCAYRISAEVRDASGAFVYGATTVKATVSELAVGIHTDKSLYKLEDVMRVSVKVHAYRGSAEGVEVSVTGRYSDGAEISRRKAQTDARGMVLFPIPVMKRGMLTLQATAKDALGRTIIASRNIWIMEGVADVGFSGDWIEIVPDRSVYSVGDEAFVLIVAPTRPTYRFLTYEAEEVIDYSVVRVASNAQVLKIRITERMSPNFYLAVALVKDNSVLTAEKMILVPPKHKRLRIKTSFDKKRYLPRDTAQVEIVVTDAEGRPVEAEISVGLVDEALYLVREELTPNIVTFFYPVRRNGVGSTTTMEMPSVYSARYSEWLSELRGDVVEVTRAKRYGGAAPPEAVAEPPVRDLRRGFAYVSKKESRKLGAEDYAKVVYKETKVRREFVTTAFWSAHIVTGNDGRATFAVRMPDNLTEWRLTLRAVTSETLVCEERAKTETRKDVLARVAYPRFLRVGDIAELGMIAHNRCMRGLSMRLRFDAEGLNGPSLDSLRKVDAGGLATLFADYRADKVTTARLSAKALSELESDAVELRLPVLPRGIRKATSALGVIREGEGVVKVLLPDDVDVWTARLKVGVNPTVHSVVAEALKYLVAYPYGCVEQTMSRFMPALVAQNSFQKLGVRMPSVSERLPSVIEKGLHRLYKFQHRDGGWGWWENDATDPVMTAYVVLGLTRARRVDVKVDGIVFERGVKALERILRERALDYTAEAYAVYALTEAYATMFAEPKEGVVRLVDSVFDDKRRAKANAYTKALIALALENIKRHTDALLVVSELEKGVKREDKFCYWGEGKTGRWNFDSVETTAFCIIALSRIKSDSRVLPTAVGYLIYKRDGTRWKSTRDTAAAVLALTEYAGDSSVRKKVTLTVSVNGKEVHTFTEEDPSNSEAFLLDVGPDLLRSGENEVRFDLKSGGPLNYFVLLSYQSAERRIRASEMGFGVSRKYSLLRLKPADERRFETVHSFIRDGIVKRDDIVLVEVKVRCDKEYEYFMLTDHLPAGFEVDREAERLVFNRPMPKGIHREIHDDKVLFFVPSLKKGRHTFRYIIRPTIRGLFSAPPAVAELMYFPDIRGNSCDTIFEVR